MSHTLYFPIVGGRQNVVSPAVRDCDMVQKAAELCQLIIDHPRQERRDLHCNPLVVEVAQHKAKDLQVRNYFSHADPDGESPNALQVRMGVRSPSWYSEDANMVESIAGGYREAHEALEAFLGSPAHEAHILGLHRMYFNQRHIGVGYSHMDIGIADPAWVVYITMFDGDLYV